VNKVVLDTGHIQPRNDTFFVIRKATPSIFFIDTAVQKGLKLIFIREDEIKELLKVKNKIHMMRFDVMGMCSNTAVISVFFYAATKKEFPHRTFVAEGRVELTLSFDQCNYTLVKKLEYE
jgi:hypothetical protein